jgi:hypothetical protein
METKAPDSLDSIKYRHLVLGLTPWGRWSWVVTLALLGGAILVAPSMRTVAAIALALAALVVELLAAKQVVGPYAAVVADVVVTRELFLEDSEGRTRAWLGVEAFGDETGAKLVLYDSKGQARLSLRDVEERFEYPDEEAREAEPPAPTLVMFGKYGNVIWRAP